MAINKCFFRAPSNISLFKTVPLPKVKNCWTTLRIKPCVKIVLINGRGDVVIASSTPVATERWHIAVDFSGYSWCFLPDESRITLSVPHGWDKKGPLQMYNQRIQSTPRSQTVLSRSHKMLPHVAKQMKPSASAAVKISLKSLRHPCNSNRIFLGLKK